MEKFWIWILKIDYIAGYWVKKKLKLDKYRKHNSVYKMTLFLPNITQKIGISVFIIAMQTVKFVILSPNPVLVYQFIVAQSILYKSENISIFLCSFHVKWQIYTNFSPFWAFFHVFSIILAMKRDQTDGKYWYFDNPAYILGYTSNYYIFEALQ